MATVLDGRSQPSLFVRAAMSTAAVDVKLVDLECADSVESDVHEPGIYRFDLCLDQRPAGSWLHFSDYWPRHRVEQAGKVFLLPPGQTVHANSGVGRQRAIICRLRATSLDQWLGHDLETRARRIEASVDLLNPIIQNLILRMAAEARNPGFASEALVEAFGIQMAIELERHFLDVVSSGGVGGLAAWRLRIIDERLNDVDAPPTLAELAALCRLSARQLARGFRASRDISIGSHIAQVRIAKAKRLLAAGDSVKAVAYAVGFASPSSLCFAFRQATGISPRQYQMWAKLSS